MLILRLVWAMMFATVVTFGMVGWFSAMPKRAMQAQQMSNVVGDIAKPAPETVAEVQALPPDKLQKLVLGFAMFSLVTGVASIVLRRKMASKEVMRRALKKERDLQLSEQEQKERVKDAQGVGANTPGEATAARAVFTGYVISWAFAEAVAIHGFALSQIVKNSTVYLFFGVPAVILLIINRPRVDEIKEVAREFEG